MQRKTTALQLQFYILKHFIKKVLKDVLTSFILEVSSFLLQYMGHRLKEMAITIRQNG